MLFGVSNGESACRCCRWLCDGDGDGVSDCIADELNSSNVVGRIGISIRVGGVAVIMERV